MASFTAVTVDAEGVLVSWLNSLTSTLVGNTRPFMTFVFEQQRSPGRGTYGVVTRLAGVDAWAVEAPADMARMSCSIFSTTKKAAAAAALAYANTLRGLSTVQPIIGTTRIRLADNLSGPLWIPNVAKVAPQYLVDADVYFIPTT
jgi:hypothetical protein